MNTGSLKEVFPSSSSSSCIYHSGNDEDVDEDEEEEDIRDDVIDIARSDLVVIDGDTIGPARILITSAYEGWLFR
jgi:hypothetical protein